ncbi:hypothetical protein CFB82_13385 [Burkholderia sp. HI2714]|uniref:patatin-like phospholipase family protein n=1 Tax=Burkholderia sp. HI2714 TaxID=2015359 RepID=UPI000B7A1BD3|nr:patatin-like phospholipase family protein [Burkholderia sp. HI2714]OXJ34978.1 hypothetical protein CFB82_13385 [Burkholderia sp. HI2714]
MNNPTHNEPIQNLSLSGGGFRAAFFHFGALYALAAAGRLRDLKVLITVSGGSIAGAFFLQAVQKAGPSTWQDDKKLADCAIHACQALYSQSKRNPRGRILSSFRALCQGLVRHEWGFSKALIRLMSRWFKDLSSISPQQPSTGAPEWRIAATSYTTTRRVLLVTAQDKRQNRSDAHYIELSSKDIPVAIAASSALPGIFEPVTLNGLLLGDGGILDNLGVHELATSDTSSVCVDASAEAAPLDHIDGWSTPMRAMDMLLDQDRAIAIRSASMQIISLRESRPDNQAWRNALRSVRTDLDDFTFCEANLLYLSGYQAASDSPYSPPQESIPGASYIWRLMTLEDPKDSSNNHLARLEKIRKSILNELERGKFGIGSGFRKPSLMSVFMSLSSIYMALAGTATAVLYAMLAFAGIVLKLPPSWQKLPLENLILVIWIASSIWLFSSYAERGSRKLSRFSRARQIFGAVLGPSLLPAILIVSIFLKFGPLFPVREHSMFTRIRACKL